LLAVDSSYVKANDTDNSNLLSILRREPEGSRLILKVGGGGAGIIALWILVGTLLLPVVVTLILAVVMLVVYGVTLIFVTGSIVKEASRYELEAAVQAQRLGSTNNRPRPAATNSIVAEMVGSDDDDAGDEFDEVPEDSVPTAAERFHQMYFSMRLEQEVRRCRLHGERLSAVVIRVELPAGKPAEPQLLEKMSFDIAKLATDYPQAIVLPNCIGPAEYGFCLLNVGHDEAKSIAAPLLKTLGNYYCEMGIASYPEDDGSAEALIARAKKQLDQGRIMARSA
jgi:hypothetical protein